MARLDRTIRRAARRVAADRALAGAGWGLLAGAAAGLGALGLSRVAGLPVAEWVYPGLVTAAVAAALALALRRAPSRLELAVRLDRGLRLKDRLGTAEAVRAGRITGPFAELAARDAEQLAARLDVRGTTPIRIARVWAPAVALTVLLAAGVLYMPAVAWAATGGDGSERASIRQEQRAEIVQTIDDALEGLDEERLDDASREELDLLDDLARQLGDPGATDPQLASARDESAARLETMADRLAEQSRRNLDALDELARRADEFAPRPETQEPPQGRPDGLPEPPPPPPAARAAEQFTEALGAGEFEEAAEQFDRLMEAAEELPPESRQRLAERVRELAEHLEKPQESPDQEARRRELREALEDLGADEQTIDRMLDEPDRPPPSLDEALDRQTVDEDTRRDLQRDLEQLREQEQVRREAREQQRRLADALENAAERLEESSEPRPRPEQQRPEQPPPQEPDQRQERGRPQGQEQGQGQGQGQPQEPEQGQGQHQPQPPPREQQVEREGEPTGEPGAPGARPEQVPRSSPAEREGTSRQGEPRPAPQPGPGPEEAPPAPPAPMEQPEPGQAPAQRPDVGELLRRMQRMRRDATEQARDGERLRDAARRIADNLSEEEKQRLVEQWMASERELPGEPPDGSPGGAATTGEPPPFAGESAQQETRPFRDLDDVDLRDAGAETEQVIAEWLSSEEGEGAPVRGGGGGVLRRARTDAEQAIEKSTVPSRYHELIRRYFGRIEETARRAAPSEPAEGPSEP